MEEFSKEDKLRKVGRASFAAPWYRGCYPSMIHVFLVSNFFCRYKLNGRETKNVLKTALAISRYEKVELSEASIQ